MRRVDVVIWGDFPPKTQTGISMVNAMVEKTLLQQGKSIIKIDESVWQYSLMRKIILYLALALKLFKTIISKKCRILYFNFPLSRFGLIKLSFLLPLIRLISLKTKLISHLHRGDLRVFSDKSNSNKLLLRFCLKFIDEIIVLSEIYIDDVKRLNSKVKVTLLRNTSSIERTFIDSDRIYNRKFLCISNYIRSKGIGELVDSFRNDELKDFHLTIYGNIYDTIFFDDLNNKKTKNISLEQAISRSDLDKKLKENDCFILPSWNEGQPLVILEAMSLGVPIIATQVGDIPNMLGNDYPFLVKPMEIEALKISILNFDRFLNKPELGRRLYNSYLNSFSNKIFNEKISNIFA
ncbi:MAG: glycosyltransferase [Bacteroidales bacterium]|nr:MAG: glycosyltransferase [Bacteroidales bacterium]